MANEAVLLRIMDDITSRGTTSSILTHLSHVDYTLAHT